MLLAATCWLLAASCWLLAVGCWLLAAGCWLLAAGCLLCFVCWAFLLLAAVCWLMVDGCLLMADGGWLSDWLARRLGSSAARQLGGSAARWLFCGSARASCARARDSHVVLCTHAPRPASTAAPWMCVLFNSRLWCGGLVLLVCLRCAALVGSPC